MRCNKTVLLKFTVYFVILTLCIICSEGASRVVGGIKAPAEFGKFHASLQNLTGHHVCGGVVVSKKHLLTAAHCLKSAKPQFIKIVVGTTNLDVGGIEYNAKSFTIHEEHNSTARTNDIAIIKINGFFDLDHVNILPLPNKQLQEGDFVILTGFGAQKPHGESSRQMYALNLTVFSQETCRYAMRYSREITDSMFCTFTRFGQGTCHGDSGGPLIKDNELVGLVSWGIPCAVGFPDVHTRIHSYVDWIQRKTKIKSRHYISKEIETEVKISLFKDYLIK